VSNNLFAKGGYTMDFFIVLFLLILMVLVSRDTKDDK
jgi:hypothetical protein